MSCKSDDTMLVSRIMMRRWHVHTPSLLLKTPIRLFCDVRSQVECGNENRFCNTLHSQMASEIIAKMPNKSVWLRPSMLMQCRRLHVMPTCFHVDFLYAWCCCRSFRKRTSHLSFTPDDSLLCSSALFSYPLFFSFILSLVTKAALWSRDQGSPSPRAEYIDCNPRLRPKSALEPPLK